MWLFLSNAFLSIVTDRDNPDHLLVRARQTGDIERVFPSAKVRHTPNHDYAYRASLPRAEVAAVIAAQIEGIQYPNFKNSVTDPDRHRYYYEAYSAMYDFGRHDPFKQLSLPY